MKDSKVISKSFGMAGRLIHTPGHTPGSLTVVLENGEIIVGDMFSGKKAGEGYKAVLPIFASDMNQLKESLKRIEKLEPEVIYNSHGTPVYAEAVSMLIRRI